MFFHFRMFRYIVLVAIWIGLVSSAATEMNIVWLNKSSNDPLAVCNDGTPSAYYISKGVDPALSNTVLLFLQGGGQCYSEETCKIRPNYLMSSRNYDQIIYKEGIFDSEADHSSLWAATKVFIPYCSSDGWIGDASPSDATWGYHFRGQRIVRSALNDLIATAAITGSSRVFFGGGSAGARGMMNNVDFLVPMLPSGATVLGAFLDSPYTIDIAPYNDDFVGFQNETMEIYNRYNVSAIIPSDCAQMYSDTTGDSWKCLYGQYRMPFVRTKYLLVASQYDSYQLSYNVGTEPIAGHYVDPKASQYAKQWSEMTVSSLKQLVASSSNAHSKIKVSSGEGNLYHSWACYNHDVSESSRYYSISCNAISLKDAVAALQAGSATQVWMEECNGLFCGSDCEE